MFISLLHILYLKPSADPIFVADTAFYYEGDPIPIYYSIAKRLGTASVAQDVISQYTSVPLSDEELEVREVATSVSALVFGTTACYR